MYLYYLSLISLTHYLLNMLSRGRPQLKLGHSSNVSSSLQDKNTTSVWYSCVGCPPDRSYTFPISARRTESIPNLPLKLLDALSLVDAHSLFLSMDVLTLFPIDWSQSFSAIARLAIIKTNSTLINFYESLPAEIWHQIINLIRRHRRNNSCIHYLSYQSTRMHTPVYVRACIGHLHISSFS